MGDDSSKRLIDRYIDMNSKVITFFHLGFVLGILSLPFWPLKTIPFVIWGPFLLSVLWIKYDGCPLTKIHEELNDQLFSQVLLKPFWPSVSKKTVERFTYTILIFITIICGIRYHLLIIKSIQNDILISNCRKE
ncbi:MAG: hypothetical protein D3916_17810 [Candidatus Electrothrix sp. MAN1_4]|nr:hypothetical protein [Candidatus Electrothrix sp. MAN1_4]